MQANSTYNTQSFISNLQVELWSCARPITVLEAKQRVKGHSRRGSTLQALNSHTARLWRSEVTHHRAHTHTYIQRDTPVVFLTLSSGLPQSWFMVT